MNKLLTLVLCLHYFQSFPQTPTAPDQKPAYLPSILIDSRFYIKIPVRKGDTILAFCNTGGGFSAIYQSAIHDFHLDSRILEATIGDKKIKYILAKDVIGNPIIPAPHLSTEYQPAIAQPIFETPVDPFFEAYIKHQAYIGQYFFIDHSWTFDYPNGKIYINTPLSPDGAYKNMQHVGFKKDGAGRKIAGLPSIKIEVDGQELDVLFDTGSSLLLSKSAQAELNTDKKTIAGSFIAKSVFDKWHKQHPDWRIIEKGDITGAALIQVPAITVGATTTGPEWFAMREDSDWPADMITSANTKVQGTVGGGLLKDYKVIIDYNSELAAFEKIK